MSNNRRRRPLASEREATFAIGLIISILVALSGVIFLLSRTAYRSLNEDEPSARDLLAPKRIKSSFSALLEHIPDTVQGGLLVALISGIFGLLFGLWSLDRNSHYSVGVIFGLSLFILPISLAFAGFEYKTYRANPNYTPPVLDHPTHYKTIFRYGDTPHYNEENQYTAYTIRIPRGMEWNSERMTRFVEQLVYSFAPLLFRIVADEKSIGWEVVDLHGREPQYITNAIHVIYPEAHITYKKAYDLEPLTSDLYRLTLVYKSANSFVHPFRRASDVTDFDPLTTLISAMNSLQSGERVSLNLFVIDSHQGAYKEGQELITVSTILPTDYFTAKGWRTIAELKSAGLDRVEKYIPRDQRVVEDKLRDVLYQAVFMIQVDSPNVERVVELADTVDSQTFGLAHVPYNSLQWYGKLFLQSDGSLTPPNIADLISELTPESDPLDASAIQRIFLYAESNRYRRSRWATRLILTSQEMALFWHLPHDAFIATRIRWLSSRTVPPPPAVISEHRRTLLLGYGTQGGKIFPVRLPQKDREGHLRILGKTGVGKSTLLFDLIRQDILFKRGVVVIDPHGSLVELVLRHGIWAPQRHKVVVYDLADRDNPPPLNPLRGGLNYVQVGQIVQSIEQMYPATGKYPRLSHYLRTALLTLNADPEATVRDIVRLFTNSEYRAKLVSRLDADDLIETWDEYEAMKATEKRTITEPIRTRISPFYTNPHLAPMMCHPDGMPLDEHIKAGNIVLISLKMDDRQVPEAERNLIGSLLLSRLQVSGMQRAPGSEPYYVYIDEIQRFVTSSLDDMFSEARKFGLSLTVAHQYLDQLPDKTQSSLIGNVGATILFASSPDDAKVFLPHIRTQFDVDDVVGLDQFTTITRMQHNGTTQSPFTLLTPLPPGLSDEEIAQHPVFAQRRELVPEDETIEHYLSVFEHQVYREEGVLDILPEFWVREHSRRTYTPKTMAEVKSWIKSRYGRAVKLDDQGVFFDE